MTRSKVKPRPYHHIAHLYPPPTNVPTKYKLLTPHGFQDIALTRFLRSRSLWARSKVKSRSRRCIPISTTKLSTFYTSWDPRISPDKIFNVKVTTSRLKVKSRSHHDVAHLQTKVMFQVSTSYTSLFLRYSLDKLNQLPDQPSGHHG